MPNQNASTWLELPTLQGISAEAQLALNDRFRTIAQALDSIGATGTTTSTATASGRELILTVPGTLGIQTNAAPLVSLPDSITPGGGIVAMLKQPPQGASVKFKLQVGGADYTAVELPAGSSLPVLISGALGGVIAANALVTLNIIQVGTTFPGADLSVLVRF